MANKILILTDDTSDASTLKEVLDHARDGPFEIEWVRKLSAGLDSLLKGGVDAVLVDLSLPDCTGMATFDQLFAASPQTPIMLLCAIEEEPMAIEAVQRGAQGYLSKGHFLSNLLPQSLRNIIQRKVVEEASYKEKARAEIALNSISDAVICTDLSGQVDYLNIAAEKLTGWLKDKANGHPISDVLNIINAETRKAPERHPVYVVLEQNKMMELPENSLLIRHDGSEVAIEDSISPIHDKNEKLVGSVIVFHDVSAAQAMTVKMAHLAQHDFLTDLPNRVLLNDRIAQAITLAKRRNAQLAVLFLDLDNFKHINDSLGHETGDKLLQSVAQRLEASVRGSDTVSRQGGDEFVILLADGKCDDYAAVAAEKILDAMAAPHSIAKSDLHVTTSIGISIYPTDGKDAETLIKSADTAMYHAKENGRNNYQFFKNEMNIRAVERQFIEANLRHALERHEFVLHYQPKVNLSTDKITGAEALLRWVHPEWGMVLPAKFIAIAEDCGLIVPIGRWVMREACVQARQWSDAGLFPVSVAVNISAVEFRHKDFLKGVRTILNDTKLPAACLQLEITEGVLMRDAESSTAILEALKSMGVQLAVDDFGTGYSSLSYLKQFPINVLKIDQSFVRDINCASDKGVIVSAVIGMGNSLKHLVVAEGIENQAQLTFLKDRHCEEGQGYFFSRPLVADEFTAMLSNGLPGRLNVNDLVGL